MISISPAEQAAFQSSYPKTLTLNFPSNDPLTNEDIYLESAHLEQSVCEENNLTFGIVYSSYFSVRIFDNGISYTGSRINPRISVDVEGTTYERSLGGFTVKSDKLTADKLYRDLECYDYLTDVLPVDFHEWHNSQPDTFTLKQYRDAFFSYVEIEQENISLPIDDIHLTKFTVTELTGANIISSILQLNGAFGFLASNGKFKYVLPKMQPDYLIDDNSYVQGTLTYEDEPIRQISGVKIIGYSDDYGEEGSYTVPDVSAGTDTNSVFTIEDNYLIHACDEVYRQRICDNIYLNLRDFMYYPASVNIPPYIGMEPGDVFKIETERKDIFFPVLKRTLKGISALMDSIEANGESDSNNNVNSIGGGVSSVQLAVNQVRESVAELLAGKASISAQDAAIEANIAANSALTQLSIVEDVAGTLHWISEHGSYTQTTDTTVHPGTVYFIYQNGDYVPIAQPDPTANPSTEGWYVLDVTDSQSEYLMAHLAVTNAGLWVLPVNGLAPHPLVDSDDNPIVDSDGNSIVDFSQDPQNADGYKILISAEETESHPLGVSIYNDTGTLVANYGTTITLGMIGSNRFNIKPTGFEMTNSVGTPLMSVSPNQTQTNWKKVVVVSYSDDTEVIARTYIKTDSTISDVDVPFIELDINGNTSPINTGITCYVVAGESVSVTISSDGVDAILDAMRYETTSISSNVTTDTTVDSSKTYYIFDGTDYVVVTPTGTENPSSEGWYEQITITNYYPCTLTVTYMADSIVSSNMDLSGNFIVTGYGYPVSIINNSWSAANGTDTMMSAYNATTGIRATFGVGSGGYNHGVWSSRLNDWMIYTDQSGMVRIPRVTTFGGNLNVSGGVTANGSSTVNGNLTVGSTTGDRAIILQNKSGRIYMHAYNSNTGVKGIYCSNASGTIGVNVFNVDQSGLIRFPSRVIFGANVTAQNSSGIAFHAICGSYNVALHANTAGNRGVYDTTSGQWIIYRNASHQLHTGVIYIDGDLFANSGAIHLGTGYGTNLHVSCVWSDNNWHDIITRNGSSNDVYIGGSKDITGITTRTFIRGDTIKLNDASGASISSDRNIKKDIATYDSKYDAFYDALNPVTYKFINGKSGRTHSGFISQDVRDALLSSGLSAEDFGGYVKDELTYRETDTDGSDFETSDVNYLLDHGINEIHQLIYQEFIALNTWQIQKLKARVAELEARLNE